MTTNAIDEFLYGIISATVTDAGDQIYPDAAPAGTKGKTVIYQLMEGDPNQLLDCGPSGEGMLGYQLRIYAPRRREANEMRDQLGVVLENRAAESLADGLAVEAVEYAGLQNKYDHEAKEYGSFCAVRIHWRKS